MDNSLRSIFSVLLVVAVVVGGLPAIAPTTAAQSGAPDGMTTIGSTQISEDLPSGADVPIRASDLEGSISSSDHASTMDVVLTTPERASEYVDGPGETNTISAGNLAIVVSDDTNHEGRTIGLDRGLLDKLGYEPTAVFGVHSSGDEWSAPVTYRDDVATFEVDRFSSNKVTFSGEIELDGSSASDGTQFQYELDSLDGVSDYTINLTGVENTQTVNNSWSKVTDGESLPVEPGGNADSQGQVTLEGHEQSGGNEQWTRSMGSGGDEDTAVSEQLGYVFTTNRDVIKAFNSSTGDEVWSLSESYAYVEYSEKHNLVLVSQSGSDSNIKALNAKTGNTEWYESRSTGTYDFSYGEDSDLIYIATQSNIEALDPTDGSLAWEDTPAEPYTVAADNSVVYVGYYDGSNYKIDALHAQNRSLKWSTTVAGNFGAFHVEGDTVYLSTYNGPVAAYDSTGAEMWSFDPFSGNPSDIDVDSSTGLVYSTSDDDQQVAIHDGDSVVATYDVPSASGSISVLESEGVAFASDDRPRINAFTTEIPETTDPTVDLDGDGSADVSASGTLGDGETHTEDVSVPPQSDSWEVSTSQGIVTVESSIDKRTITKDPAVEVNGFETGYNGTVADGETVSLATETSWISEGTNRINISTSSPSSGPGSLVDIEYRHEASSVSTSARVNATKWSEDVRVSNTFAGAQSDATARIKFTEETVGILDVRKRVNSNDSADWTPVHESDYSWSSSDSALVVELGDVSADTDVDLRAIGTKINVLNGSIDVVSPTIEGDNLDTRIKVLSAGSEGVSIDVAGSSPDSLVHYLHDPSYSEKAYAEISPTGSQTLRLPEAFDGSTTNVRTAPIETTPSSAPVRVTVENRDEPRFTFEHTSEGDPGDVTVTYHEALPSEMYQLYSVERRINDGSPVESENNSVTLVSSGYESSYLIEIAEISGGVINGSGDGGGASGVALSIFAVLLGTTSPIVGTFLIGRRLGIGRSSTRILMGLVATSGTLIALELSGGRLVTQALYAASDISGLAISEAVQSGAATVVVGLVILLGIWIVNLRSSERIPRWLMVTSSVLVVLWMLEAISDGILASSLNGVAILGAFESGAATVVVGVVILIGIWLVNALTSQQIPRWLLGLSTALVVIWIVEALSDGALTAGLNEVAPVMWLIGGGGSFVLLFLWIRAKGQPDTVFEITGRAQQ